MKELKINIHEWSKLNGRQRETLCRRVEAAIPPEVMNTAREVIEAIDREGDAALLRYTQTYDGADLRRLPLRVTAEEFRDAERALGEDLRRAIEFSIENVRRFHEKQRPGCLELCEIRPGVFAGHRWAPIPSVGLYVPRGRGSFPSVMYMQAIPAVIAGVQRIAAISPPDREGRVDPACLYAARICGVEEVYRVGGIQGIAALALGTEGIARVDKILGPGSLYVAAAKRALADRVDVGPPAGPSEAIVLADESADPLRVCLDLITEAEHGSDSSAFLVTPSRQLAQAVPRQLPSLLQELDRQRAAFVRNVLSGYGGIVVTETLEQAIDFINRYAPEHLQLACRDPLALLGRIENAGEILLGQDSAFSMANYAVGCNNVIPTGGRARTCSPLSVREFLKSSSVAYVSEQGSSRLFDPIAALAEYKGFSAHALAVRRRSQGGELFPSDG
jgi:histidinol dehydrogenase